MCRIPKVIGGVGEFRFWMFLSCSYSSVPNSIGQKMAQNVARKAAQKRPNSIGLPSLVASQAAGVQRAVEVVVPGGGDEIVSESGK